MSSSTYVRTTVEVAGGELTVGHWGPDDGPTVVVVHGITSNHLALAPLAAALPECHLVGPDLRGRGGSHPLPGPWGMVRHAADVAVLIESLGAPVVLAGHSMGGFVAAELARTRPELVAGLVLIDGGLPLRLPPGLDLATVVAASLGPAQERLAMTFPTRDAYRAFWRPHPALVDDWSPLVEDYLDYDLVGEEPALRSSVRVEAVAQDSAELFERSHDDDLLGAFAGPARVLFVDKGLLGVPPGLYPPAEQAFWRDRLTGVEFESVPDLNHYTLVLGPDGAAHVAAAIRAVTPRA